MPCHIGALAQPTLIEKNKFDNIDVIADVLAYDAQDDNEIRGQQRLLNLVLKNGMFARIPEDQSSEILQRHSNYALNKTQASQFIQPANE